MAAHLFGYVSEVTEAQLKRADYKDVEPGAIVGQAGVELAYNKRLMGTDGNKTVVVNSVGREIDERQTLSYDPEEGRRLQLTIDADVQQAAEDGFAATSASTAPPSCSIRATAKCSRSPAGRPTTPTPSPPASTARPGPRSTATSSSRCRTARCRGSYSPGSDLQDGGRRLAGARGRGRHAGLPRPLQRRREFYGRYFQCWKKGGHGIDRPAPRDRAVVRRVLLHRRQHARGRPDPQVGDAVRAGREVDIDLPNELQGLVPSTRVEGDVHKEKKWYAGETISVVDRPGAGVGDAAVAGRL